tara:strand:+ start:14564 stop:15151 length:588 start_codon:yes stop_codon:yes gene_type:complete
MIYYVWPNGDYCEEEMLERYLQTRSDDYESINAENEEDFLDYYDRVVGFREGIKWDKRFLFLSEHIASWSKDRSTKVGCVIVGPDKEIRSTGYNGFPRGLNDDVDARHDRPQKYQYTEHAERNAIFNALLTGASVRSCTLYCSMFPCSDCTRAIIQAGIRKVVTRAPDEELNKWGEDYVYSLEMLGECGVEVKYI